MTGTGAPALPFDRRAWRLHRERAVRRGAVRFLHDEIAARLGERLDLVRGDFAEALALGLPAPALPVSRTVAADPAAALRPSVVADPELLPFRAASFDLAVSNLVLHWNADLPGALAQLRRVLRPDGLLLAALFGGQTLVELRTALLEAELAEEGGASPRVSPTVELGDAAALLQRAGFAMPVADTETVTVTYADLFALMRDLRGMGETNALAARRRTATRRATLARAAALYAERFAGADGRIPATFEILFLTGRAPPGPG